MTTEHRMDIGETVQLQINSKEYYSTDKVSVKTGETYRLYCDCSQRWKDAYISSSPNGYFNILTLIKHSRVKKAKCFCLCGAYNEDECNLFPIGCDKTFDVIETGNISFFANDVNGFYYNNKGSIIINVTRIN